MAWKAVIVERLADRNIRESSPVYQTLFSLVSKKLAVAAEASAVESQRSSANNTCNCDARERYCAVVGQLADCNQRNKELDISLKYVEAQLNERKISYTKIDKDLSESRQKVKNLEGELGLERSKTSELELENARINAALDEKNIEIDGLEKQLAVTKKENEDLKATSEVLQGEHAALVATLQNMSEKFIAVSMEASERKLHVQPVATDKEPQPCSTDAVPAPTHPPNDADHKSARNNHVAASLPVIDAPAAAAKIFFGKFTSLMRSKSDSKSVDETTDEFFVVTPEDMTISTCNYPTKVSHQFDAHEGECSAVQWSPRSKLLATAGTDRNIKLWTVDSFGLPSLLYCSFTNCPMGILALEFDTSESHLAAACSDNTARIWRLSTKKPTHVLSGHSDCVTSVRFGGSGEAGIVTGSRDRTIRLWDSTNWSYVTRTILVPSRCNDLALLTGSGISMASGHSNRKVYFWDYRAERGKPVGETDLTEKVTSVNVNAALPYQILAMTKDDTLHLVDCRNNRIVQTYSNEGFIINSENARATLSPDGQFACAGSMVGNVGSLHIWSISTGKLVSVISPSGDVHPIVAVSWQPSGRFVASVDKKRRCTLWSDY